MGGLTRKARREFEQKVSKLRKQMRDNRPVSRVPLSLRLLVARPVIMALWAVSAVLVQLGLLLSWGMTHGAFWIGSDALSDVGLSFYKWAREGKWPANQKPESNLDRSLSIGKAKK